MAIQNEASVKAFGRKFFEFERAVIESQHKLATEANKLHRDNLREWLLMAFANGEIEK